MASISRRRWLITAAAAPAAGTLLARGPGLAATEPNDAARDSIRARYLPNVVLRNQDNAPVRFYDDLIKDKIVTINFMYASCEDGVCPLITANLVRVQQLLGDRVGRDIFMYSITLNPKHDTPRVLKQYAKAYGVRPGWQFLTGKPDDLEYLRRKLRFVDVDPKVDKDRSRHSGTVRYGNEPRTLWSAAEGQAKPEFIAQSILWVVPKPATG